MRFEFVTIFPEILEAVRVGLLGKAVERGALEIDALSPRAFATDKHRSVDDAPYGGGSGMVMMAPPVAAALDAFAERRSGLTRTLLLTPQGALFDQRAAERLAGEGCVTFVCGRYEGFDERIRGLVDEEVSLGDFVLLGGEVAALAIMEAIGRLVPGVLGNRESAVEESHTTGLLEYPQYTRPPEFRGDGVPEVLLSGHHARIAAWRRRQSLRRTLTRRPELLEAAPLSDEDRSVLRELTREAESS